MTGIASTPQATTSAPGARATRPLGVVGLGHIKPVPGIAAHPDTFDFPTIHRRLDGPDLISQAVRADPALYPAVLEAARELVGNGAAAVITTCGYFAPYQAELAAALPVPVVTSSLLQLPSLLTVTGPARYVLVVAAVAEHVDDRCLAAAGVPDPSRVRVIGMERPGPFREQVLDAAGLTDIPSVVDQTVRAVGRAVEDDPRIGAICLECADLALASDELRARFGVPVLDYLTVANWLYAGAA